MLRKMSSPSRPASQALISALTSLRLSSFSSVLSLDFGLLDRLQRELGRNRGQMRKRPLAALDLFLLRHADLEQMADGRGKHVLVAFEIVVVAREASQRPSDVGGDGGFLGDDQTFGHGAVRVIRGKGGQMISKRRQSGQGALRVTDLAQSLVETARKTSNVARQVPIRPAQRSRHRRAARSARSKRRCQPDRTLMRSERAQYRRRRARAAGAGATRRTAHAQFARARPGRSRPTWHHP